MYEIMSDCENEFSCTCSDGDNIRVDGKGKYSHPLVGNITTPQVGKPDHWFCVSSQQRETLSYSRAHYSINNCSQSSRSDTFAVLVRGREGEGGKA